MRIEEPLLTLTLTISNVAEASPPINESTESTTLVTTVPALMRGESESASDRIASALDASMVMSSGWEGESRWREWVRMESRVAFTVVWYRWRMHMLLNLKNGQWHVWLRRRISCGGQEEEARVRTRHETMARICADVCLVYVQGGNVGWEESIQYN